MEALNEKKSFKTTRQMLLSSFSFVHPFFLVSFNLLSSSWLMVLMGHLSYRKATSSTSSRSLLWVRGPGSSTTKLGLSSSSTSTCCLTRAPPPAGDAATARTGFPNPNPNPWRRFWTASASRWESHCDTTAGRILIHICLNAAVGVSGAELSAVHARLPEPRGLCRAEAVSPERAEHHGPGRSLKDPERLWAAERL